MVVDIQEAVDMEDGLAEVVDIQAAEDGLAEAVEVVTEEEDGHKEVEAADGPKVEEVVAGHQEDGIKSQCQV